MIDQHQSCPKEPLVALWDDIQAAQALVSQPGVAHRKPAFPVPRPNS